MSFRLTAPVTLALAAAVVVGALTYATTRLSSGLTKEVEAGQFELMQSILENALGGAEGKALARAEMVAALPEAKAGVAAQDRAKLLAEFGPMFEVQHEKYGVDQAQFHIPPATSLLRLNAPDKFGDDLSKFRPMVVKANRDHTTAKGLGIARSGPAIFGVAPITDGEGNHIGTFEMGLEFGTLLDQTKAAFGLDLAIYFEEKPLKEFATGVDPAKLSDQNRVGRFIRWHATNTDLLKQLAADADISVVNEPVTYVRSASGVPYGVLLYPIKNGAGDSIGVVVAARDFSASRAAAGQSLVWAIAYAVFAIVALAGMAIIVIRGGVLRPVAVLDARLAKLAAGERDSLREDSDKFPAEIEGLARRIETFTRKDGA